MEYEQLPIEIKSAIEPGTFLELGEARLGNDMFRVRANSGCDAILKIGSGIAADDIDEEVKRLLWLGGRYCAPDVLAHTKSDGRSHSVISWLGENVAHELIGTLSNDTILQGVAGILKEIHSAEAEQCPFVSLLESELAESEQRLRKGLIDEENFFSDAGERPAAVFESLVNRRHLIEERTFTHGDFCFPNVIFCDNYVCGVVDWGLAGVSDPHRDFMSIELTIRRNMAESDIATFYRAYGVDAVDEERVRYFWLLDRFFTHFQVGD